MVSGSGSLLLFGAVLALGQTRTVETVLPALSSGGSCWSAVELVNLGDAPVTVEIEAHREGGGLVPLEDRSGMSVRLQAGERGRYRMRIPEVTSNAWARVGERIVSVDGRPVIAVNGVTECVAGDQLISTVREPAYPLRNPWFTGDVAGLKGALVSVTNTSEQAATASLCYSSGGLFSVPDHLHSGSEFRPICSAAYDVQIAPFAARQFPVARDGSTHFELRIQGGAVALQMLRPLQAGVRVYTVDSTIRFGGEVPGSGPRE